MDFTYRIYPILYIIVAASALYYLIYWILWFRKLRKTSLNVFEKIIKFLIPIPLLLSVLFVNIDIYIPTWKELIQPLYKAQKVILENNSRGKVAYLFYSRDTNKVWQPAYPISHNFNSNKVSIAEKKSEVLFFRADSFNIKDRLYIKKITLHTKHDTSSYARAYKIPALPVKLSNSDFDHSTLTNPDIDYTRERVFAWVLVIIIPAIWYHSVLPFERRDRLIMIAIACLVTINSLYNLYLISQTVLGFYYIPFTEMLIL